MRGNGRVFQRGQVWWIAYYDNGREHRESSGSRDRKDAVRRLRQRLGEGGNRHGSSTCTEAETRTGCHDAGPV